MSDSEGPPRVETAAPRPKDELDQLVNADNAAPDHHHLSPTDTDAVVHRVHRDSAASVERVESSQRDDASDAVESVEQQSAQSDQNDPSRNDDDDAAVEPAEPLPSTDAVTPDATATETWSETSASGHPEGAPAAATPEHDDDDNEAEPSSSAPDEPPTHDSPNSTLETIAETRDVDLPSDASPPAPAGGGNVAGVADHDRERDDAPAPIRPELAELRAATEREQEDLVADTPVVPSVEPGGPELPLTEPEEWEETTELEGLPRAVEPVEEPSMPTSVQEPMSLEKVQEVAGLAGTEEPVVVGPEPSAAPSLSRTESSAPSLAASTTAPTTAASTAPTSQHEAANGDASKTRRESMASVTTVSAPGSSHLVSGILIVSSLESIAATKEAKKSKPLKDALDAALDSLKSPVNAAGTATATSAMVDPHVVFLPLRLACETKSLPLMITALDCLSKLVSYDFFVDQHDPAAPQVQLARDDDNESLVGGAGQQQNIESLPLADQITSTVCDCFSPSPVSSSGSSSSSSAANAATTQHDTLLLRLLSCLLGLILSSSLPVHQSALLKAVRTVYNVFLLGRPGTVQTVAQATLGQIVGGVFGRVSFGETLTVPSSVGGGVNLASAAAATDDGRPKAMPTPSRSQSRTDLASVAEEREGDSAEELDEGEAKVDSVRDGRVDMDADADADQTPRVSVTEDPSAVAVIAADQPEINGSGERVTRCVDAQPPALPFSFSSNWRADVAVWPRSENLARLNGTPIPTSDQVSENDLFIKDAFLVFRALCKLSMKPLGADR